MHSVTVGGFYSYMCCEIWVWENVQHVPTCSVKIVPDDEGQCVHQNDEENHDKDDDNDGDVVS